jgi:hypothetical protein
MEETLTRVTVHDTRIVYQFGEEFEEKWMVRMETKDNFAAPSEKGFFETLVNAVSGTSEEHKRNRIKGLEEFKRRITSDTIQDKNEAMKTLLNMAEVLGNSQPECALIIEDLRLLITTYGQTFEVLLSRLTNQEEKTFLCFSKVVHSLDHDKKRQAIKPLVDFLMSSGALTKSGVNETYLSLISLGNEGLGQVIVEAASPYLDSSISEFNAIFFSVRLCGTFADRKLLPKMLAVLDKSINDQFMVGWYYEIERAICEFLGRIGDSQSLTPLMDLLKKRSNEGSSNINEAIANVLNANPSLGDEILEKLYDERHDKNVVDNLLQAIAKADKLRIDIPRLLSNVKLNWWWDHPTRIFMREILVKQGNLSKPPLIDILRQGSDTNPHRFDFALECLKAIGISREEIAAIFPMPPILQVYDFYGGMRKPPISLDQIWKEKQKLGDKFLAKNTTRLDHLLYHIFASFNFVTLNVDPAGAKGVDTVCFHPETLDLFIVGCTTGILKDDLAKMDSTVKRMKVEMKELFHKCSVTPIVVCTEIASIPTSDEQYAVENQIVIMQRNHIDTLLEMLETNRQSREVIDFVKRIPVPLKDRY